MKRIAFFQSDLGVGGIQKSLVNLLRNIDYSRYEVELFLSEQSAFWQPDFPAQLRVRYLKPVSPLYRFLPFALTRRLLRYDFSACGVYDLAVDFNSYQQSCAVGAATIPARRRVMWVHNNVEQKLAEEWKYRVLWHFFKGKFACFDEFVCVSGALIEPFQKMSGVRDKSFRVIQNYIDVQEIRRRMGEDTPGLALDESCLNFVALGRLCHQKGYDLMLEAFAQASRQREALRLYIIGDGPNRAALEQQRAQLGLEGRVFFLGNRENPYAIMRRMDAFVSSSRYEGQGMNIMEAMAVGLPVYCTKNLEENIEGLQGCADLAAALASARKEEKRPDDLAAYNRAVLQGFEELAEHAGEKSFS